jgi:hypothetical protein
MRVRGVLEKISRMLNTPFGVHLYLSMLFLKQLKIIIVKNKRAISFLITGAISFFMLFSAFYTGTHKEEFHRLGFPNYFRIELTIAKIIGAIALLIPQTPARVREWIYAAFGVCLLSAFLAKYNGGYPAIGLTEPLVVFMLMIFSVRYLDRLKKQHIKVRN